MTMSYFKPLFSAALVLCVAGLTFAQTIAPTQIPLDPPKIVNFKDRADYEIAHPVKKKKRFVEQGEDREKLFKFKPKPVGPNAVTVQVPAPTNHQRATANSPAPSTSFNGTMDNGTLIPPDIRGAVGPNHVMETDNQEFKIFSKTGTLISTVSITTFFSASGGSGYFDPHVVYDAVNGRWLVCIDGNVSNGHGGLFLAVSQTNDPTAGWYVYSFDAVGTTTDFIDYPLLGYNTNWVVITANDFTSNTTAVGKIYTFNRASVYAGSAGTINTFTDNNAFTLAPAQTIDNTQTTEYLVQDWNGNSSGNGYVQICTITGTASAPVYTAGSQLGINQPWSETSVGAKQSGSTKTIESGDTRIGNAQYINGSLWFCQTAFLPASAPTRDAVQYWQINPATLAVQQFGRVDDATTGNFYFYPSIAVNANGDALLGYCQSSASTYASASYSLHASADAASTLQNTYLYKAGVANYYKTFSGTRNRWGDYTGTAVDPTDNSFWNFSEWANTNNTWGTVIAHVPVTAAIPCNAVTGMTTTSILDTAATFNWTASSGATSYNVQYRRTGTTTWSTGSTTGTSYTVASGLTAGTTYEWQVQTVCATGSSAYTASTTFTTTGTAPCNSPTSLTTTAITTTSATFNWVAATGAVSYSVQYRIVGSATWLTGTSTTTSYNATGLTATSNYEWQVKTVCSATGSAFTASATFTTATPSTCSDIYEPNNSYTAAKVPAVNTNVTGFITPSTDVDWYKVTTTTPNTYLRVDLSNLPGDYDLALYKSNGSTRIGLSQNSGTTAELIKYSTTSAATYYVKVYGYGGANSATACYTLKVSTGSTAFAPEYADPVTTLNTSDAVAIEPALKLFPNPAKTSVTVEYMSSTKNKVSMSVYNMAGQQMFTMYSTAMEGLNTEHINTEMLSNGNYIFEVNNNGETQRKEFIIAK